MKTGLGSWKLETLPANFSKSIFIEMSEKNIDGSARREPSTAFLIILEKLIEDLPNLKTQFTQQIRDYSLADNIIEHDDDVVFVKQLGFDVQIGQKVDQKIIDFLAAKIDLDLVYFDLDYFEGQIRCSLVGIVADPFNRKFQVSLSNCKFNDGEGFIECY